MAAKKRFLVLGVGALLTAALVARAAEPTWAEKMQKLKETLPELLADVASDQRFYDPKNKDRILANTKKLSELAHALKREPGKMSAGGAFDTDPSIGLISGLFDEEVERAYVALKEGHRTYARGLLRSVGSYCISCHTRTDFGPNFPRMELKIDNKSLTSFELADLYAATRQFDRALAEYDKVAGDPKIAQERPIEWEKAVKRALAIAVRVNKDPDKALKLVQAVLDSPTAPLFFKAEALAWQDTIRKWKKEPQKKQRTVSGYFAESRNLITLARGVQKYPADQTGDVYYLRASAVLHELMRQPLSPEQTSEAFYLAGVCYEALQTLGLWTLPEIYYETCIQRSPHSVIAENCYQRYERSVYLGYSGSGGFALPADVKSKLKKLQELAKAQAKRG